MEQKPEHKWDGKQPDPITVAKEGWYDKLLRRVPLTVKSLDIIIAILFLLLIGVVVLGVINGNR